MSFIDRIASALAPAASDSARAEARRKAEQIGRDEPWVAIIIEQHKQIESLVTEAMSAMSGESRRTAVRELALVLTGHATAEEAVLYPEMADHGGKTHAGMGYEEHAMTKIQLAKLEKLDPLGDEWSEKLSHIQSALQQHMYQEEGTWLPSLASDMPDHEKAVLTTRFIEEYKRYCGEGSFRKGGETAVSNYD